MPVEFLTAEQRSRYGCYVGTPKSKELDTENNGKGISENAILDNQEARVYYEQHRSWRGSIRRRAKPLVVTTPVQPQSVKLGRDEQRVRQR